MLSKCIYHCGLCFQLYAAISQNLSADTLGLSPGTSLICSLKQRVVMLASNTGVLNTIQRAAQSVLVNGWMLLLPTVEERARALSSLLPSSGLRYYNNFIGIGL